MAMRETAKSLRAYFVLVGLVSLGSGVSALESRDTGPLEGIGAVFAVAFGIGFLTAGIRLPRLLEGSTRFARVLLFANVAYQMLIGAVFLWAGAGAVAVVFPALYIAISWYLLANVKRLARERRSPPPPGATSARAPRAAAKSQLVPIGVLLVLLGPVASQGLSALATSADAAGTPHLLWILTDAARAAALIGLGCVLVGVLRNRRWRREAQQPA